MAPAVVLTSLGSGVCTAVLNCLEGRRDDLVVVGIGSDPRAPDRARCDDFIEVPPTADPAWSEVVASIVAAGDTRAIIPGRCDDVVGLAHLALEDALLGEALIAGPMPLAVQLRDTGLAAQFARSHGLPFAPTVCTGLAESPSYTADFLKSHEGPWVIKPSSGQGSRGAVITRDPLVVQGSAHLASHVIQPYLGSAPAELGDADPLSVIDARSMLDADAQVVLGPTSQVLATGAFATTMSAGRVVSVTLHPDPSVADLALTYAEAFAAAGWRGPANIQAAQGADGQWLPFEINPRFGGGSHARSRLGFDEVRWCVDAWLGESNEHVRSG